MSNHIIVALDGLDRKSLLSTAEQLAIPGVWGVKVNDALHGENGGTTIVRELKTLGLNVFADAKFHDIPNTVYNGVSRYVDAGADIITVHASGGAEMMEAAVEARAGTHTRLAAVTVLTSIGPEARQIFGASAEKKVAEFTTEVVKAGIDTVVCSPHELSIVKKISDFTLCITPGIRPTWYTQSDDQERTDTPLAAMNAGADFLVIGRPIVQAENIKMAVDRTLEEMKSW